jgi:hypothetical protein
MTVNRVIPARIASRLQRVTFGKVVLINAREYRITRK